MTPKNKTVEEHDEIINTTYVAHYESHEDREESKLFKKTKKEIHKENIPCFINNGKCEGGIEIHHNIIEWSAQNGVDWEKVQKDHPEFNDIDERYQMMALCEKHHRHKGFGIHTTPYPIWILQKYMNDEALEDFENAVMEKLYKK
jgi:hypothetical protein